MKEFRDGENLRVYCADHSALVQAVGRVEATAEAILEGQRLMRDDIKKLSENSTLAKVEMAKETTKIGPFIWVVMIIAGVLITAFMNHLFR